MERISRTIGTDQVVDDLVRSFTHDIVMDHLLPVVPPPASTCGWPYASWPDSEAASSAMSTFTGIGPRYWSRWGCWIGTAWPWSGAEQAEKVLAPRAIPANALLGAVWRHLEWPSIELGVVSLALPRTGNLCALLRRGRSADRHNTRRARQAKIAGSAAFLPDNQRRAELGVRKDPSDVESRASNSVKMPGGGQYASAGRTALKHHFPACSRNSAAKLLFDVRPMLPASRPAAVDPGAAGRRI
jgi:hypothetical protein